MNGIIVAGLALVGLFLFEKSTVVGNLKFVESAIAFDLSNPLRPIINLTILVQNPTSGSLTLQSLAGYFYINGTQSGNVSYFQTTGILPNSQTPITLQLSVNDLALVQDIAAFVKDGSTSLNMSIQATANVNNVPMAVNLSFNPIP